MHRRRGSLPAERDDPLREKRAGCGKSFVCEMCDRIWQKNILPTGNRYETAAVIEKAAAFPVKGPLKR